LAKVLSAFNFIFLVGVALAVSTDTIQKESSPFSQWWSKKPQVIS